LAWTIEFDERAKRDLSKLDKLIQKRIRDTFRTELRRRTIPGPSVMD
jgi:mRNA-degrading endonuclease RelE of RelBE toxin-antitoxin system